MKGYVAKLWKDADLIPICKKRSSRLSVNYRNVSAQVIGVQNLKRSYQGQDV